ncbi:phage tail protein [Citrobacter freundii]|uniref:phage tail-collar fiber domain-containing protein n=3 Tax=Enterobacterales TaxID=91347 RepID=UPI002941322C|nr:phage tail protein [Citrobacter freundii]ELR6028263.1 phage tail protein [Citrobacter freundii]MEA8922788.1 phage tail protein [Citrobacter freundii]MEA8928234.1 phage tail protein [Citrobacter freundii]
MTAKYFAILTNQGAARLANAAALGTKLNLTQMAVGDANGVLPTPDPAQTKLINQKRIAPLNLLTVDPANTSQIIAEQIIPENEGGFWIREIGLYDDDGILIAVANCPETYKPELQEGSGRTQTIRMILIVSSTSAITLKIDPSVVLATRQYVDDKVIEVKSYADGLMRAHEQSRNHPDATTTAKGFTQLNSSVTDDRETQSATPKAVKIAMDNANARLAKERNLSDLPNPALARQNLQLGDSSTKNTGTTANTVAAGDDARITGAMQKSQNGADIQDVAKFLQNLGIIDGLDFTGDISAPNMRGSTSLTVGDGTGGLTNGGVDGAGFDGNNLNIKSWNGIGFQCSSDKVIRAYISTKLGIIAASEYVYAGSANLYKNGDVYGDKWSTGNGANWLSLYLEQLDSQIRNNLTSWTSNNFPTKADVSVALSGKPGRQYIKEVGVYQNDKTKPFMLHDDNSGIFLATMSSVHLDANGWHRDASTGLITQWGSGNVPGSQQQRVNFPMAFPNTCATVIASDTGGGSIALSTMSKDNGGFTVRGASSTFGFNWFAMGY